VPGQDLSVTFEYLNTAVPLSGWSTAAIAVVLAATALLVLRRKGMGGSRLFGWMLAVVAGSTLVAAGPGLISEAQAVLNPLMNLTVSPGTLSVAAQYPTSPLTVVVANTTGRPVRITGIDLVPKAGAYSFTPPPYTDMHLKANLLPTCFVSEILENGAQCIVTVYNIVPI